MPVIDFGSTRLICMYGSLSVGAEHQAFFPSKRANCGELSALFEDDAAILSSGIPLLFIPRSSRQLFAKVSIN